MDPALATALDIAVPSAFAGVVAVAATIAVERLGGVSGGILSSIPTTIVPAALGIHARSADPDSFRRAMAFVPVGILMNAGYLLLWRVIPARLGAHDALRPRLLAWTVALALVIWLLGAAAVVGVNWWLEPTVGQSIAAGCIAFAAGIALGVAANRTPHPAPRGTHRVGAAVLVARGLAAAAAIAVSVILARAGHPVASGIASVFPAIFTTIMIATWLAQGAHVPTGAVGPMALGTLSVSAYALLAAWAFPIMHPVAAAAACWIAAVACVSVPALAFLARRRSRPPRAHAA